MATLFETPLQKGDFPDRNSTAVVLASELHRIGFSGEQIESRILEWNRHNSPPLKPSEIRGAIRSGTSGKYEYSCNHPILAGFCIGSDCPYDKRVKSHLKKVRNHRFLDYGWQHLLSNREVLLYFAALPYLEAKRQVGPGGMIYANHQQLADVAGISVKRIGRDLQKLADAGLIHYKPGIPRKWERRASEIRRIIPIPQPKPIKRAPGETP